MRIDCSRPGTTKTRGRPHAIEVGFPATDPVLPTCSLLLPRQHGPGNARKSWLHPRIASALESCEGLVSFAHVFMIGCLILGVQSPILAGHYRAQLQRALYPAIYAGLLSHKYFGSSVEGRRGLRRLRPGHSRLRFGTEENDQPPGNPVAMKAGCHYFPFVALIL